MFFNCSKSFRPHATNNFTKMMEASHGHASPTASTVPGASWLFFNLCHIYFFCALTVNLSGLTAASLVSPINFSLCSSTWASRLFSTHKLSGAQGLPLVYVCNRDWFWNWQLPTSPKQDSHRDAVEAANKRNEDLMKKIQELEQERRMERSLREAEDKERAKTDSKLSTLLEMTLDRVNSLEAQISNGNGKTCESNHPEAAVRPAASTVAPTLEPKGLPSQGVESKGIPSERSKVQRQREEPSEPEHNEHDDHSSLDDDDDEWVTTPTGQRVPLASFHIQQKAVQMQPFPCSK